MTEAVLDTDDALRGAVRRIRRTVLWGGLTLALLAAWGAGAPLTTSISVAGRLSAANPITPLQSSHGGRLQWVDMRIASEVTQGDPLLRFDVSDVQSELAAVEALIALQEVDIAGAAADRPTVGDPTSAAHARIARQQRLRAFEAKQAALLGEIAAAEAEAARIDVELDLARRRSALSQDAMERRRILFQQGATTANEVARAEADHLDSLAQVERLVSQKTATDARRSLLARQVDAAGEEFRREAAERALMASERLAELTLRRDRLRRRIDEAVVVAPVSGTVVEAHAISPGQVVQPGEVLAQLAPVFDRVEIDLVIPPRYIDQIVVGQRGTVQFPTLPQRSLPRIGITITAVALAAQEATDTQAAGYPARASVDDAALESLSSALGTRPNLQRDMPVQVLIEGRSATVLSYILRPVLDILRQGAEEG